LFPLGAVRVGKMGSCRGARQHKRVRYGYHTPGWQHQQRDNTTVRSPTNHYLVGILEDPDDIRR